MAKFLVVVDFQNDFITGSLGTPEAEAIVDGVIAKIDECKNSLYGDVIATLDTHYGDYLDTPEGEELPVKHCIFGTHGWLMPKDTLSKFTDDQIIYKHSFGYDDWVYKIHESTCSPRDEFMEIEICGLCTDICVITNALVLKTFFPHAKIKVLSNLCAGTTPENHQKALDIMRQCQIEVV